MTYDAARSLADVLRILLPVRDILDGRVDDPSPPSWCERRGWTPFLLALSDDELHRCEAEGLASRVSDLPGAPGDLVALAADITGAARLPVLDMASRAPPSAALRAVPLRKRAQLAALLGAIGPMAERASRIVDVGAGNGHFTRLAAELLAREAVGIERDRDRVTTAAARASLRAAESPPAARARFLALDAAREALAFAAGDLAVGLHACGELGDHLISAAAEARCDVALVSCCLQKISGDLRPALSRAASGIALRRDTLGLTNLSAQPVGIEVSLSTTLEARETRYALMRLLRERGADVASGEEMRGINRRRARAGLRAVASIALAQRSLPPPSDAEIRRHEDEARQRFSVIRRLSLPRSMIARLVELAVVLDRAAALEERGLSVEVATLFDRAVTPRNIAVFASRDASRLPRAAAANIDERADSKIDPGAVSRPDRPS